MNEFIIFCIALFIIVGIFAITRALWQWILGTGDILKESKKQTVLLKKLLDNK